MIFKCKNCDASFTKLDICMSIFGNIPIKCTKCCKTYSITLWSRFLFSFLLVLPFIIQIFIRNRIVIMLSPLYIIILVILSPFIVNNKSIDKVN